MKAIREAKKKLRKAHHDSIIELQKRLSSIDKGMGIRPDVRGADETIDRLVNEQVSISRFGDGEIQLVFGWGIHYQRFDPRLQWQLKRVLRSSLQDCLIGVPDIFGNNDRLKPYAKRYWAEHLEQFRHDWHRSLDLSKTYYDAGASRVFKDLNVKKPAGRRFDLWKEVWDGRDLVIIEGALSRLGVGNDLFANAASVRRIIGPPEDAYSRYDALLAHAMKCTDDSLFILALGPTATVLSHELAQRGRRALDLGHIDIEYEWFLRQEEEVVIPGKYTNEAEGGRVVDECLDEGYRREIVVNLGV